MNIARLSTFSCSAFLFVVCLSTRVVHAQAESPRELKLVNPAEQAFSGIYVLQPDKINDAPVYALDTKQEGQYQYIYIYLHDKNQQLWVVQPVKPDPNVWQPYAYGIGASPSSAKWQLEGMTVAANETLSPATPPAPSPPPPSPPNEPITTPNQNLSGNWRDSNGGEIEIVQSGNQIVATGKNEAVTQWWDRATATLNGQSLTMTFTLAGQSTAAVSGTVVDSDRIQWSNASIWQRYGMKTLSVPNADLPSPAPPMPAAPQLEKVTGLNVTYVELYIGEDKATARKLMSFRQTGPKKWTQKHETLSYYDPNWNEVSRDETTVLLQQKGKAVRFNLQANEATIGSFTVDTFELRNASAEAIAVATQPSVEVTPLTVDSIGYAEFAINDQAAGNYRQIQQNQWLETTAASNSPIVWTELKRDPKGVYLQNQGLFVRLDLDAKTIFQSNDGFKSESIKYQLRNPKSVAVLKLDGTLKRTSDSSDEFFVGTITNIGSAASGTDEFQFYFEQSPGGRIYATEVLPAIAPKEVLRVGRESSVVVKFEGLASTRFSFPPSKVATKLFVRIERANTSIAQLELERASEFAISDSNPLAPTLPGEKIFKHWTEFDVYPVMSGEHTIGESDLNIRAPQNSSAASSYHLHIFKLFQGQKYSFKVDSAIGSRRRIVIQDAKGNQVYQEPSLQDRHQGARGEFAPTVTGMYRILVQFLDAPATNSKYMLSFNFPMKSILSQDEVLRPGDYLKSDNGLFTARLEENGTFSIYMYDQKHLSWTSTPIPAPKPGTFSARLNEQGRFVVRREGTNGDGETCFETELTQSSYPKAGSVKANTWHLKLLDGGNFAIYAGATNEQKVPVYFSPGRNDAAKKLDIRYPRELSSPNQMDARSFETCGNAPFALTQAAQAGLRAVYEFKDNVKTESRYDFYANDEGQFKPLGLEPNARVTFFRRWGPRELTFFIASDDKQIIIAIRGTETDTNWKMNGLPFQGESPDKVTLTGVTAIDEVGNFGLKANWALAEPDCLVNAMPIESESFPGQLVHRGWSLGVQAMFPFVLQELESHQAKGKSITITGHSLGGALTGYLTYRLLNETDFFDPSKPHLMATFAAPRYALKTDNAAPMLTACEYFLRLPKMPDEIKAIGDRVISDIASIGNDLPKSLARIPEIPSFIERAVSDAQNLVLIRPNPVSTDFEASMYQLQQKKAPLLQLYSVETKRGDTRDAVTDSWSLGGMAGQLIAKIKKPLSDVEEKVTFDMPSDLKKIPGVPAKVALIKMSELTGIIDGLSKVGETGFGSVVRIGQPIDVPSEETETDQLHDSTKYLNSLEAYGQLKSTKSTSQ
jgi:Lipase (class 3)